MTDPAPPPKQPSAEANGQLIVSLTTVIVLGLLGGGMIAAAIILEDGKEAWIGIAAIAGGLVNSLTAPTGISNVLRANAAAKDPTP